ncbi:hypothetical protein VOM14_24025 [Paraburkholderia sp. MPAMCS5]|nr:hypothetical protein [Paraburkholderia sp. MPAMCS5]
MQLIRDLMYRALLLPLGRPCHRKQPDQFLALITNRHGNSEETQPASSMSCPTPVVPFGPLGQIPETVGHVHPRYALVDVQIEAHGRSA